MTVSVQLALWAEEVYNNALQRKVILYTPHQCKIGIAIALVNSVGEASHLNASVH